MNISNKLYNLSINILENKNIEYDIDICIWILEKINTIESKNKIGELYITNIYKTKKNNIINLLECNINQKDILATYYLAYIYMINNEYYNTFLLLKDRYIIDEYEILIIKNKINFSLDTLILFIGIYLIDKNIDKILGKKYLSYYFSKHKLKGVYKYILYSYCNEYSIEECYNSGDLFSCYYLGHNKQNIKYFVEFIKRYKNNFYIINYVSINKKLNILLEECNKYVDIYKLCKNYIDNNSLQNQYNLMIQKYNINTEILLIQ